MAATHYGPSDGTAIVFYPNQPTRVRENGRFEYRWRGWCATSSVESLTPAEGTAMSAAPTSSSLADAASYELIRVEVSESNTPNMSDIVLVYALPGSGSWWKDGDTEKRARVITREIPVGNQALYDAEPTLVANALARGDATVSLPGIEYEYAYYDASFTWSEAELIAVSGTGIGKTGSPTGLASPSEYHWQLRGKEISETKGLTRVGESWEYSPLAWPADT